MNKLDVLYGWIVDHLNYLSNSDAASSYAEGLGEGIDDFTTLTEQIRGISEDLSNCKQRGVHFVGWVDLRVCVLSFVAAFSNFPGLKSEILHLFIIIADEVANSNVELNDGAEIDAEIFKIVAINRRAAERWFVYENRQSFSDSVVVFDWSDFDQLLMEKREIVLSPRLALHFLATLVRTESLPGSIGCLIKNDPLILPSALKAFVTLVMVANGKQVHLTRTHTAPPITIDKDLIRVGSQYQQMNDVIYVLSEYNGKADVLSKYLTVYHVIENFMFKMPIVWLESQNNGQMFSIRDFRRLYKEVENTELIALRKLFSEVFKIRPDGGKLYSKRISDRWAEYSRQGNGTEINAVIKKLGLRHNGNFLLHGNFAGADLLSNFTQIVYSIRNAIVHNKETEFHMTYETLEPEMERLITAFLLPSLEEISFGMVCVQNPLVWYTNKYLLLYNDS